MSVRSRHGLRFTTYVLSIAIAPLGSSLWAQDSDYGHVYKDHWDVDVRSSGRLVADEVAENGNHVPGDDGVSAGESKASGLASQKKKGNVQVNDATLDNIQEFAGFRPFVKFTQSETSVAAHGRHVVATYNSSADQPIIANPSGPGLVFTHRFFSGFSVSHDGGRTWTSGFMPPVAGSIFTFGDPSVDVDRRGNFYFAGLGADAAGRSTIQVNISTDDGATWSDAIVVQQDNGGDKEWIAVGRDPHVGKRDNVYVTWTSFGSTGGSELRFGRSFDGGKTWATKTIFAPGADPNPANPQNAIQFSNPVVDRESGRLYVPFLHFSNADQDFIRILISDDAGDTFSLATFNIPGAPDAAALPVTSAGELIDCGSPGGGLRLTIHSGADVGGGRFGLRRFVNASRLVTQPAFAAADGVLFLAWSNSTSTVFGDPNADSNILFIRSDDGGQTWTSPVQVNTGSASDPHHVLPSLTVDEDGEKVHVAFYSQHSDGSLDVDMASSEDGGSTFPTGKKARVSKTPSSLAPTNIPIPTPSTPFATTNYDRTVRACYSLGEYLNVRGGDGRVLVLWGDERNTVAEPTNALNPLSGQSHPQQDVFFQSTPDD